jgi:hypothetical protein
MGSNNAVLMRAIRGPIILITLGVLFTIDYFGNYRFYRTWPVLLIVFGAMKLLERISAGHADAGARPPQGGPV